MTSESLIEWINENEIIKNIFDNVSHPEVIKKSGLIIEKMANLEDSIEDELEMVWGQIKSEVHEETVEAAYEVMV